jgi:hypothetical protein
MFKTKFRQLTVSKRFTRRAREVRTVIVCLPANIVPGSLPEAAARELAVRGVDTDGVVQHFLAGIRSPRIRLADCWEDRTSGGPLRLLDLTRMRDIAQCAAAVQWLGWQAVVEGTRPARPFWHFTDRHQANPRRYTMDQAWDDYLSQERVIKMTAFNAMPNHTYPLPVEDLELFQAGYDTYVRAAWLAAVPANGMAIADTTLGDAEKHWLTPRSERLADQLEYLRDANRHLDQCDGKTQLIAMGTPI